MVTKGVIASLLMFTVAVQAQAQSAEPPDPSTMSRPPSPSRPTDSRQAFPIDPSENVKALSEAANKRQDDLRILVERLLADKIASIEKINELRYQHAQELAKMLADKLADEAKLRADSAERLSIAEAKRIDAIRAVDVNAVAVSSQRTTEQASALQTQTTASAEVLRNQVTRSAEDLRALVATTAATQLQNQQQQFAGIVAQITTLSSRLTQLEQLGAEGKGRQAPPDPVITALLAEVRTLQTARTQMSATDAGRGDVIGWIVAGIMLLLAIGGFVVNMNRSQPAARSRP